MSETPLRAPTLRLIEAGHRYSAFYQGDLSNHLPMALLALDRLGATDDEIAAFAAHYETILEPLPPAAGPITGKTAADFLGRREAFTSWVEFFSARIASAGAESVVREWLGRLMPGIGSVAFHGLLRLAYAAEIGSDRETAYALAQWAADYATLGDLPALPASGAAPAEALARLKGEKGKFPGDNIVERMQRAKSDPDLAALVASAGEGQLSVAALAQAMLGAYAATGSFTLLHGITACHAFRTLTPLIGDLPQGRRYLWQALACAYVSAGGPKAGSPLSGNPDLAWEQIRRRAAVARDEHDIKLAYTCLREWQFYGDDLYRRVAGATFAV